MFPREGTIVRGAVGVAGQPGAGGRYLGIGVMRGDKKTIEVDWGMRVWVRSQHTGITMLWKDL